MKNRKSRLFIRRLSEWCAVLGMALLLGTAAATKPEAPLAVKIKALSPPAAGQVLDIEVRIRSHLATDALGLRISLPPGVELLDGQLEQALSVSAHELQIVPLRLRLPEILQGHIDAVARIQRGGETRYAAGARLPLARVENKPVPAAEPALPQWRDGRGVREFILP